MIAAPVTAHESCDERGRCSTQVRYVAVRGVANSLTVTRENGAVRFVDTELRAGKGCTALDVQTVRCTATEAYVYVELGDGDDVATSDVSGMILGGPGNDRITAATTISGGPGSDELQGADMLDDDGAHPAPDRYIGRIRLEPALLRGAPAERTDRPPPSRGAPAGR